MSAGRKPSHASDGDGTGRFLPALALPVLAGCALRLVGLRNQILIDDEMHTLRAVLALSPGEIVRSVTYEGADYCIPLSLLFRVLVDSGVVLTDWTLRMPSLLAGVAALFVLPLLARSRVGDTAALVFAWLLAISPMLALYSQIVRPYMLVSFSCFVALCLFDRWLQSGSRRAAAGFVAVAALSAWLHLGAGVLLAAPFAWALLRALRAPDASASLPSVVGLGAATAVAMALPLLPAFSSLQELLAIRRDGGLPGVAAWVEVVALQAGTRFSWLGFAMLALAARGAWVLRRRDVEFFGLLATTGGLYLAALLVLSPDRLQEASVLSRYLLVLLPVGLLLAAQALAEGWERVAGVQRLAYAAVALGFVALLVASGPFVRPGYSSGSFHHGPSFLRLTRPPDRIPAEQVPAFYHELAREEGDVAIIEHPWLAQSSHTLAAYQNVHGKRVIVSSVVDSHVDPRVSLRNVVRPLPNEYLASAARHAVVHLDLRAEAANVESPDPSFATWLEAHGPLWEPLRRSGRNTAERLARRFGEPFYRDEYIAVWDLQAARDERARLRE